MDRPSFSATTPEHRSPLASLRTLFRNPTADNEVSPTFHCKSGRSVVSWHLTHFAEFCTNGAKDLNKSKKSRITLVHSNHSVSLGNCCKMDLYLRKSALTQPKTSLKKSRILGLFFFWAEYSVNRACSRHACSPAKLSSCCFDLEIERILPLSWIYV